VFLPDTTLAAYMAAGTVGMLVLALGMAVYVRLMLGKRSTWKAVLSAIAVAEISSVIVYLLGSSLLNYMPSYAMLLTLITGLTIAACYMAGWMTAKALV
jgi:hypothetical protein